MYKVTIGVPVYNSDKLIRKALDSFVEQTMNKKDFEVICVDDCSTDNSIKVIKEYEKKLNLRILKLKENSGGPGEPRNKVIEQAKGEFIFFVDSDDYINPKTIENTYKFAKKNNSDIVLVKMKGVNGRGVPQSMFKETDPSVDLYNSRLLYAMNPLKLFNTHFLRGNNISFPANVKTAEDQIFIINAYLNATKISTLADTDYYYATKHDGIHASAFKSSPQEYYYVINNIIETINNFTKVDKDKRNKLIAIFLERHFKFSRTTTITKTHKGETLNSWLTELANMIELNVPLEVFSLVEPVLEIKLNILLRKDFSNYILFEKEYAAKQFNTQIVGNSIYANFTSLKNYNDLNMIDLTDLNRLKHRMSEIAFTNESINFYVNVDHSFISNEIVIEQDVHIIISKRNKSVDLAFKPIMYNKELKKYYFQINYNNLINENDLFGIWDFFISSKCDTYELVGRLGNNREFFDHTPVRYISSNTDSALSIKPFFTNYNNLSLDIEKHNVSKTNKLFNSTLIFDSSDSFVTLSINKNLLLNNNSVLYFDKVEYAFPLLNTYQKNGSTYLVFKNDTSKNFTRKHKKAKIVYINDFPIPIK